MIHGDLNEFFYDQNTPYPHMKELSYENDKRKVSIGSIKAIKVALIIFIVSQIVFMLIAFLAFWENNPMKFVFCFIQLPFIIIFAFVPCNSICIYDYISKTFSSYITPIIPIPYTCLSTKINFNEISGFYLQKFKRGTKKYYKLGVKSINETEQIIAIGQDTSCKLEFDNSLDYMPYILRALLKPGEQNYV